MTRVVKPEIHDSGRLASVPPARLNRIDVHTSSSIAEHKIFWSSIPLERHQFLKDGVVHWKGSSPTGLTPGAANCPSEKVHMFPLQTENLTAPHARVKSDRYYGAAVISSSSELRKQFLLFF